MSPTVRASASITLNLDTPREIPDPVRSRGALEVMLTVDQVTWEHTWSVEHGEALRVRALNSETFRGDTWYLVAGAAELIRDVPAWVPIPPAGWDLFVLGHTLHRPHAA